jgi:hypothetical protein
MFFLAIVLNVAIIVCGLTWNHLALENSAWSFQYFDNQSFDELPELDSWYIEELNSFEEQVQAIWGDAEYITPIVDLTQYGLPGVEEITGEAVLVDNLIEFPMVLNRGEPNPIPVTPSGYWIDSRGKLRDARGRFARLPRHSRLAA